MRRGRGGEGGEGGGRREEKGEREEGEERREKKGGRRGGEGGGRRRSFILLCPADSGIFTQGYNHLYFAKKGLKLLALFMWVNGHSSSFSLSTVGGQPGSVWKVREREEEGGRSEGKIFNY